MEREGDTDHLADDVYPSGGPARPYVHQQKGRKLEPPAKAEVGKPRKKPRSGQSFRPPEVGIVVSSAPLLGSCR